LLALPLVLLCVLSYLGSAAHFVLVQHSTCLEHGELVHEEGVEQGDAPARMRPSFADKRIARTDAKVFVQHGEDAHCAYVFLRRVVQPPVRVVLPSEAPVLEGRVLETDSVAVEPPVAWLHLAPKSSPPRA
ncbi:MAG: hypothetical protein ACXU86_24565, partial [Archangium sp.]